VVPDIKSPRLITFPKEHPVFGKNRRVKVAVSAALITLGFIAFQGITSAHNPEISATAECIVPTDQAIITIDVHSWNTDLDDTHRTHNRVVLAVTAPGGFSQTFNNKFNAENNFGFTQTLQVPADGKTYTATASTDKFWGPPGAEFDNGAGDQSRSVNVTVPMPCIPATTTTVPPTSSVSPTSIVQSTTAPTTTVPVSVQGVVETAPTTAPPPSSVAGAAVQGVVLARTGSSVMPLVIGGVVLVLLGTAVELNARRRRTA
jgi:hypothetical protein